MLPSPLLKSRHAGYHGPGAPQRFFEGWYYRVSLPKEGESFAFMYSIEDPGREKSTSGGFAQVLGPKDERVYQILPNTQQFWASRQQLALGHWHECTQTSPALELGYLPPETFDKTVLWGYQATDQLNQGLIHDAQGNVVRWQYRIEPEYGWGLERNLATMGLFSYLPVFEPGWQILMNRGAATGWVEWKGERYEFSGAPAYGEKNWGGAFPKKWFWVQANAFSEEPDLALISGGGIRGVLWGEESVAMAGLHYQGKFYEFMPTKGETEIHCTVQPWGHWQIEAEYRGYRLGIEGISPDPSPSELGETGDPLSGIELLAPTLEGPQFVCRDSLLGKVLLKLYRPRGRVVVEAQTNLGGLETGGGPWDGVWKF
jgi:tocopherol cyclase